MGTVTGGTSQRPARPRTGEYCGCGGGTTGGLPRPSIGDDVYMLVARRMCGGAAAAAAAATAAAAAREETTAAL